MSESFLSTLMRVAVRITRAERAFAVNQDLQLVESYNLTDEDFADSKFSELAETTIQQALQDGEPVLTNNFIRDPSLAPVTNTGFTNLRIIVVLPIPGHGAVYLDQLIRNGLISREMMAKLMRLVDEVVATEQFASSENELLALYTTIQ